MILIEEHNSDSINQAVAVLKAGGVISFATETVYALACDAKNDSAVKKLYQLKKREEGKPIAVLVKDLTMAEEFLSLNFREKRIARKFMPGALTLVARQKQSQNSDFILSKFLNDGAEELGFRIPDYDFCLRLLEKFNGVIAATSANLSDQKAAVTSQEVIKYFADKIDLIINGGICKNKIASTVIKITTDDIKIIRSGLIKKEQIYQIINL